MQFHNIQTMKCYRLFVQNGNLLEIYNSEYGWAMDGSGEILTIFIGQAGTQLANACWELFCLEHGVSPNGCLRQGYYPTDPTMCTFFSESQVSKCIIHDKSIIGLDPKDLYLHIFF